MSAETKVPEIRFKEFSGDWRDKEIGSILAEAKRPVELLDNELYQLVTVKRRNEGVVPRSFLKGKNILVKNYYGIKAGDYLISKRQVVHGANGIVPESLDNAVVSNEYLVVTDSDEITAKFWTVISKRPQMHKLFFISSYGVDIEKLVFDVTDWKNRVVTIPDVTEQSAITDYFRQLDSLINQHQQKHDKLSNIKQAMLEKMFPKKGETIPEIRFKGFREEWKEKGITDISKVFIGLVTTMTTSYRRKGVLLIRNSDIKSNRFEFSVNPIYLDEKFADGNSSRRLMLGDVVTVHTGDVGTSAVVTEKEEGSIGFATIVSRPIKNIVDSNYLAVFLNTDIHKSFAINVSTGDGRSNYNLKDFCKLNVPLPAVDEQAKIGNYFHKLDALINQHQKQITKLTNIKQACLSKMFVLQGAKL
ncbi:hypothetical protein A6K25_09705 [Alteromonas stellipolaris]|uniref:restriction endonuclease subunit S n=1 Tax=Alteromonas stellipolaris TaxID=233316 RepID=UPI0007B44E39|nr:restriction endonuclease subunit S [Alteromonas stellipolaris]ANB21523.1 hypothetical protein A6K25_09705 [Alteromonas stellipolaris]